MVIICSFLCSNVLGAYASFLWEINVDDDDEDDDDDESSGKGKEEFEVGFVS